MVAGATPSTWNFGPTGSRWSEIADFQPIFARSASAVTSSEKSSIDTNRTSTTRFPMSLRWTLYVVRNSPRLLKGGLRNAVPKFEQAAITPKRYETGCQLLLIGSRIRSFDWYRPRWPWMTLNAIIALILRFFHRIR